MFWGWVCVLHKGENLSEITPVLKIRMVYVFRATRNAIQTVSATTLFKDSMKQFHNVQYVAAQSVETGGDGRTPGEATPAWCN